MNKPLSEWTLAEVKAECKKHTLKCTDCLFWTDAVCRIQISMALDDYPEKWDLSEPPRWTEQDKEDAKAVRHLMPWATKVGRGRDYDSLMLNSSVGLHRDLFPSLKPGETVTLDEIIGGGE